MLNQDRFRAILTVVYFLYGIRSFTLAMELYGSKGFDNETNKSIRP